MYIVNNVLFFNSTIILSIHFSLNLYISIFNAPNNFQNILTCFEQFTVIFSYQLI